MRFSNNNTLFILDRASNTYETTRTTQLDATLQSIDEITNMDVEMQVPLTEQWAVIVLDTNILLEFLDTVQTFVSEAEQRQLPVLIVIPGAVIHELDAQKNRNGLSWFARRASTWLLKKVKERRSVKGQALDETCKSSGNWKVKERGRELGTERANDGLILDCCQYFFRIRQCRTFLCSKDKLLAVEAESVGIPTLFPDQGSFSSRDVALAVFGREALMHRFSGHSTGYGGEVTEDAACGKGDDDGMDIDDDTAVADSEPAGPSHPLDQLHLQVIDHFSELLLELVAKVAGAEAERFGSGATSRHAPGYMRKQLMFWTASDALEYLHTKRGLPESSPRVEVFLTRPYVNGRGARRGQEWSRRDWEVALGTLGKIGDVWEGAGIRESAEAAGRVFELTVV